MSEKKQILKSASIISLVTFASRILGYVRDQRITLLLGTTLSADSFVLAYRIPNLFRRLVGEGSMTSSFIPVFTKYMREKSKAEATCHEVTRSEAQVYITFLVIPSEAEESLKEMTKHKCRMSD